MNNACKALLFAALTLCGPALADLVHVSSPAARPTHFAQAQTQKDEPLVSSARTINLTEENRYSIRKSCSRIRRSRRIPGPPACDRRSGTARCCDRAVPGRTIGDAALAPVFCGRRRGRRCRPQDQQGRRHRQTEQLKSASLATRSAVTVGAAGIHVFTTMKTCGRDGAPRALARGDPDKPGHDAEHVALFEPVVDPY